MKLIVAAVFLQSILPLILASKPYFAELERLTAAQRKAFETLKNAVSGTLPNNWVGEDINLVRYLQVTGFNPKGAENMLRSTIEWRKSVKMDQWDDPRVFAEFESTGKYPIYNDGYDREGRPIVEAYYGEWDVRSVALSGRIQHLVYYTTRETERSMGKLHEMQAQGKNVSQWILIINMEGFNLINQACPSCIPYYLLYPTFYERNYPNSAFRFIFINTPLRFEICMNIMKTIMRPETKEAFKVFGTNPKIWKPYLDNLIDPSQISDWYDPRGKNRRSN